MEHSRGGGRGTAGYSKGPNGTQERPYSDTIRRVDRRLADKHVYSLLALIVVALFADVIFAGAGSHFRDIPHWSGGQPLAANPAKKIHHAMSSHPRLMPASLIARLKL